MTEERNAEGLKLKRGERWFLVGAGALLLAGMVATFYLAREQKAGEAAPEFVLRDQDGRLTSLAQFRGKVVVVSFIDPECTQLCPLTTNSMMGALKLLGPAEAARVQLLGINVNGQKTTAADVADYTRAHGMEGHWRFLTGTPAQLRRVWKNYHVYVGRNKTGDVVHEAVTYLIDRSGDERDVYSTTMSYEGVGGAAQVLAKSIARLLPGHPAVAAPSQVSQQPSEPLSARRKSVWLLEVRIRT